MLSTLIAAPAGYAISRYLFRGRDFYRLAILTVRAFPVIVLAVPLAVLFIRLGLFDRVHSVALMHTALTLPTTVLVIGSVFASIPYELEEAAMVHGATPLQAFRRVIVPLVLPGIAASAIFTFVMSWNEVFAASILTLDNRTLTAAQLLSHFGDNREQFPSYQILQATAGTVPITRRSGKQQMVEFRRACSHSLRDTMMNMAKNSTRKSGWARSYYHDQLARGHSQSRAYRALANRWLKIIWTLWQRREGYNEAVHIANRPRRGLLERIA